MSVKKREIIEFVFWSKSVGSYKYDFKEKHIGTVWDYFITSGENYIIFYLFELGAISTDP